MIAEFHLRLMIVAGIVVALLGLASLAAVGANAVAAHSSRPVGEAASGIPMYESPAGIPIYESPAGIPMWY